MRDGAITAAATESELGEEEEHGDAGARGLGEEAGGHRRSGHLAQQPREGAEGLRAKAEAPGA